MLVLQMYALCVFAIEVCSATWFATGYSGTRRQPQKQRLVSAGYESRPSLEFSDVEELEHVLDTVFRGHLTREQRLAIEHAAGRLQTYEAKGNGCFKAAVAQVKAGCSTLGINEREKITYAVHLTRCEISTASIPIPPECQREATDLDVYACVEILSRVPQLWTSYSGYVREVVNMCFAIQYENHQNTVERLFNNVTMHQISSYRLLRRQHMDMENWHNQEIGRLARVESLQQRLLTQAGDIEASAKSATDAVAGLDTSMNAALMAIKHIIHQQSEARVVAELLMKTTENLSDAVKTELSGTAETVHAMDSNINRVASDVGKIVEQELAALASLGDIQVAS
ncbi:hypothetical protein DFJ77DRAFT_181475 [Powellomyces hirtus]|nr:hypothetical protein DFJ77DRAFT_181475 [Powellomyces hirtus]